MGLNSDDGEIREEFVGVGFLVGLGFCYNLVLSYPVPKTISKISKPNQNP